MLGRMLLTLWHRWCPEVARLSCRRRQCQASVGLAPGRIGERKEEDADGDSRRLHVMIIQIASWYDVGVAEESARRDYRSAINADICYYFDHRHASSPQASTCTSRPTLISSEASSQALALQVQTPSWLQRLRLRTSSTTTPLVSRIGTICLWIQATNGFISAVFSKSYCPYCKSSKSLLSELGAKSYIIELDQVGKHDTHDFEDGTAMLIDVCDRRRRRHPGCARGDDRPALRPEHLHRPEAHWRQL